MKRVKAKFSIGEPWDFTSPDGDNIMLGYICVMVRENKIVFYSNHIIKLGLTQGNVFIATCRYYGENVSFLEKDNYLVVSGALVPDSTSEDEDNFLIGYENLTTGVI